VEFPDLTGQPPWVVIIVTALVVFGGLGVAALSRRAGQGDKDPQLPPSDRGEPEALPSGTTNPAIQVLERALQELAEVARREAAESVEARKDAEVLRTRLEECAQAARAADRALHAAESARQDAIRELAECRAYANVLAEQVRSMGSQNGATG